MLIKILSLLLGLAAMSLALQCYSCVLTYGDNTCLDNPGAVQPGPSTVDCVQGKDCCTIVRGDHLEMKGTPWTFQRGCRPNCTKTGVYEVEDSTNVFYRTYCKTTLCNIGNGKDPLQDQIGGDGDDDENDNNGVSSMDSPKIFLILILPALALFLGNNHD